MDKQFGLWIVMLLVGALISYSKKNAAKKAKAAKEAERKNTIPVNRLADEKKANDTGVKIISELVRDVAAELGMEDEPEPEKIAEKVDIPEEPKPVVKAAPVADMEISKEFVEGSSKKADHAPRQRVHAAKPAPSRDSKSDEYAPKTEYRFGAKELRQAVIVSEILNRPVSMRPARRA